MAVYYERDEVRLELSGHRVTVADNDVARLMYYLHCVCTAIDCNNDDNIRRFIDYDRWSSLSAAEQVALIALCYTFSPDVFIDKVFFNSDALCGDLGNQFYKIHQVRSQLLAAESIVIAGQVRRVNQIMTYKMIWMKTYYLDPMKRLVARLGTTSQRPAIQPMPARSYSSPISGQSGSIICCSRRTACRVCCALFCVWITVSIIVTIVANVRKDK